MDAKSDLLRNVRAELQHIVSEIIEKAPRPPADPDTLRRFLLEQVSRWMAAVHGQVAGLRL
jgi:hypothetical protein